MALFGFRKEDKGDSEKEVNNETKKYPGVRIDGETLVYVSKTAIGEEGAFIIPSKVKIIGYNAFGDCDKLKTVIFHENIEAISSDAFRDCRNLGQVVGLEKCKKLKAIRGFAGCTRLDRIDIPENVNRIDTNAFSGCRSLGRVSIPSECHLIGSNAFRDCNSLFYLEIPESVVSINTWAFSGCANLTLYFVEDDLEEEVLDEEDLDLFDEDALPEEEDLDDEEFIDELREDDKENMTDEEMEFYAHPLVSQEKNSIPKYERQVAIGKNAFHGVSAILANSPHLIDSIIQSGYDGDITFSADDKIVSMNIGVIQSLFNNSTTEETQEMS